MLHAFTLLQGALVFFMPATDLFSFAIGGKKKLQRLFAEALYCKGQILLKGKLWNFGEKQ